MYVRRMKKTQQSNKYPPARKTAAELKELGLADEVRGTPMIRTQIYLSQTEHEFLRREASRLDQPVAAVIRGFIDAKMEIPEDAWTKNPMLEQAPPDPAWRGREDGGINHDHYIYGGPKKWIKVRGKYVEAPPLPDDYFSDSRSREKYDTKLRKLDETR
jgi:hypothetical protein